MLDQIIVVVVLAFIIFALIREYHRPGIILLTGLFIFIATGIIDTREAVSGFPTRVF